MKALHVAMLIFGILGVSLLFGAGLATKVSLDEDRAQAEQARWPAVEGEVVAVAESRTQAGDRMFRVTTQWAGPDGRKYSHEAWENHLVAEGSRRPLRMNPADPSVAVGPSSRTHWMLPAILGLIGLVFSGVSAKGVVDVLRGRAA